jgi:pyruvate formate lyase activating enzyme
MICKICPHACDMEEGDIGFCGARENRQGVIVAKNYGEITAVNLDPIEKKPLYEFYSGSMILSVGSYGCNLRCSFCQNYRISMADDNTMGSCVRISPRQLIDKAEELKTKGNIGIAYTYNEPLIGYEFVMDAAKLAKAAGLKNVVVTNGYVEERPLKALLPYVDAFNIDLKSFSDDFYKKIEGDLKTVKNSIVSAVSATHVEVTTLIIPKENDSCEEMYDLSRWLASVDKKIPYHISRFFPSYLMSDRKATEKKTMYKLAEIAKESLDNVYLGNM